MPDDLPPVQDLILEVLAARYRCGESYWTFPSRLKPHLRKLADAGLVTWEPTSAPKLVRVFLTDKGQDGALSVFYQLPKPTLDTAISTLPRTDEQYRAWMHRHELGHGAGIGTVISAVRRDLRGLTS